jgi:hypothetical protein
MADKIVIRIRNPQPLAGANAQTPALVTVYHWHRIGAALALLSVLLVTVIAGIRSWQRTTPPPPAPNPPPTATHPQAATAPTLPPGAAARSEQPPPPAAADSAASAVAAPPVSSSPVRLLSPAIRRAQLASDVRGGEPVDRIDGPIPMNPKGLVKVFLFMETADLRGQVLFHDWYWKDRLMAHTRVPVTRDSQISATSKFIDRIMTGPWRVRVVDGRKRVLAEAEFEVR